MSHSFQANSSVKWDFAIVGAGPAGALAAYLLADRGHRVLLLDRSKFPRNKVCGGCLNGSAVAALDSAGLGNILNSLGALPVRALRIAIGSASADFPLPDGYAISRLALDDALVRAAISRGAVFVDGTSVHLAPAVHQHHRTLILQNAECQSTIRASVVLACDGLCGTLLNTEPGCNWRISRRSRIGVSSITESAGNHWPGGVIHMAVARGGYVGAVYLEDGRLNIAAALDPAACRKAGGPQSLIQQILQSVGQTCPPLPHISGTGLLTRRRSRFGGHRVFAVGDAAAYVEPFTGEGIAWALNSALAVIPFAGRGLAAWNEHLADEWTAASTHLLGRRRSLCRIITRLLRFPSLAATALRASTIIPTIANRLVNALNRPANIPYALHLGDTP